MSEIHILSVGTVAAALRDIAAAFQASTGHSAHMAFGSPAVVLDRLRSGERADLAIVSENLWEQAVAGGCVDPRTRVFLGATPYSVGVPRGALKASVATADDLKPLLMAATSIALVDRSPSTTPLMRGLGRLGLADLTATKTRLYSTGAAVADALASGAADIGITTRSELLADPGVEILGAVPLDLIPYSAGSSAVVLNDAAATEAALALLQFLASPGAAEIFEARGIFR